MGLHTRWVAPVVGVAAALLAACALERPMAGVPPPYAMDPATGDNVARYVQVGTDPRGCTMYRVEALDPETHAAPAAILFWDGADYTTNADRCVPETVVPEP